MITRFFRNNLSLKIISIIVAIILWLYAVSELNPESTKPLNDIPVEIINLDVLNEKNLTLVEDPVESINIRIKGLINDIRKVNTANVKAVLDLGDIDWTGTQQVELNVEGLLPREVRLDKNPTINLTINEIKTKIIPVVVDVTGNAGEAFHVHEPIVEPRTITIYGAQSLVDSVVQGVVEISLDKDESTIDQSLRIKLMDAAGNPIDSRYLNLRQDSALVNIPIYPIKDLEIRANVIGEPADGFVVDDIAVDPPEVTVNGYTSIVERLTTIATEAINIQDAVEDIHVAVNLVQESGIYLEPGQPSKVNVVVYISETTIETELVANQVEFRNIPEGFEAETAEETLAVTVLLRGPYTVVAPITAQSITLYVDLSQVDTEAEDFEPGEFELPLVLQVPNGADVIRVSSETMRINIRSNEESLGPEQEIEP